MLLTNMCVAECATEGVEFRLSRPETDEGNNCLVAPKRANGAYLIRIFNDAGFSNCKLACSLDKHCASFDFYVPESPENEHRLQSGTCILNNIDLPTLRKRALPYEVSVGASEEEIAKMGAKRCLLFNKICLESKAMLLTIFASF